MLKPVSYFRWVYLFIYQIYICIYLFIFFIFYISIYILFTYLYLSLLFCSFTPSCPPLSILPSLQSLFPPRSKKFQRGLFYNKNKKSQLKINKLSVDITPFFDINICNKIVYANLLRKFAQENSFGIYHHYSFI